MYWFILKIIKSDEHLYEEAQKLSNKTLKSNQTKQIRHHRWVITTPLRVLSCPFCFSTDKFLFIFVNWPKKWQENRTCLFVCFWLRMMREILPWKSYSRIWSKDLRCRETTQVGKVDLWFLKVFSKELELRKSEY